MFVSYIFEIDQTVYYSATVALKIALFLLRREKLTEASRAVLPFIYILILSEIASSLWNDVSALSSARILVFSVNLFVTLNFLGTPYWRGLVFVSVIDATVYLVFYQTGRLVDFYGRTLFFSASHPNLGSELFFSAAFGALLIRMPKVSFALTPLFFAPTFLMQGRAAELGILAVACILFWHASRNLSPLTRLLLILTTLIAGGALLFTLDVSDLANKVLLLDNQYRGENTNASGRNLYWASAFEAWATNPLFGAGSDFPARLGMLQPHNFFLYPIAYYGLMGLIVLFILLSKFAYVAVFGRALYLVPFVPMLAFNDRFVNLNTYPAIMFLFLFHEFARAKKARQHLTTSLPGTAKNYSRRESLDFKNSP
ncbi:MULTISPECIES: O-antigen ligase family protein [unclassified Bradyrhizobium]|uniref:O-antigen ligase family protein n=1 Tax=unclassified Bradyrhizobium TaxID=2631580 RepID=UPI003397EA6E